MDTELFDYHTPTDEMVARITNVREACKETFEALMDNVPSSAERTLAIRKLEEVSMWANKAIVFEGRVYIPRG